MPYQPRKRTQLLQKRQRLRERQDRSWRWRSSWAYFPSKAEWDKTDKTDRIRQSAGLLIDSLDRHNVPMTERTRIALSIMKRAILEENQLD